MRITKITRCSSSIEWDDDDKKHNMMEMFIDGVEGGKKSIMQRVV